MLSEEQSRVLDLIKAGKNLNVQGPGGTGKSFLIQYILQDFPGAVVVAPTGIAAMRISGTTIHSTFRLPPAVILPSDLDAIEPAHYLGNATLLIVDEVSMVRSDVFAAMDHLLKKARASRLPFGGVQIVLIGDDYQLAPVLTPDDFNVVTSLYKVIFYFDTEAYALGRFEEVRLTKSFRQDDPEFFSLLNRFRVGAFDDNDLRTLNSRVITDFEAFSQEHYQDMTVLTGTNDVRDKINGNELQRLPESTQVFFKSITYGRVGKSLYEDDLELREGARIMFLSNAPTKQWVNGTVGFYLGSTSDSLQVSVGGETMFVERDKVSFYGYTSVDGVIKRTEVGYIKQFPVTLAWALTVHKVQSATLGCAFMAFPKTLFTHGQGYTAISRVKTLEGMGLQRAFTPSDFIYAEAVKRRYAERL